MESIMSREQNFIRTQPNSKYDFSSKLNTLASNPDKFYLNSVEEMNNYLNDNYPLFFETFELTDFIGYGGTGKVFEGKLKNSKRKQKIAFKFKINHRNRIVQDTQEILILKKIHFKYITEIYAFIKISDNSNFSVLELGKYGDLDHFQKVLLKRKVLSETMICYLTKQILESLQYIHRCKIIHMDIKQGNILIDSDLNIKLTDFSVSCSYAEFDLGDVVKLPFVGTKRYMSPEIIERIQLKIKECQKIDIYSLGITLYDLAFGFFPYKLNEVEGNDYENILKYIKKENLEFPKDRKVSDLFKDFLKGLLEKDYKKRFTIEKALNHPWIQAADIIYDEKENCFCHETFLINLLTDNIRKYSDFIKDKRNLDKDEFF